MTHQNKALILLICFSFGVFISSNDTDDWKFGHLPDILRNVSQLISSKGYPVEEFVVETEDGYLLSVIRIPHGKTGSKLSAKKPAVFLQHGLLSASSDWVLNFPQQSLGFLLADSGYDVWLGNTRGNTYSRHHVKLKPSMSAFWNFSFDQMAKYDLPAMIDYVLNKTEEKQLIYVGHSQGTTAAFALLSENPVYNEKIKLFVALAPVATVGYVKGFYHYIAPFTSDLDFLAKLIGIDEFLPSDAFMKFLSEEICDTEIKIFCDYPLFLLFGFDIKQLNITRIPVYIAHSPAGSSTKSVVHYGQMVNSKKFRKYDYGKHNQEYYNQTTPPEYDVSKITTPTALFWGMNDELADVIDVNFLHRDLKSLVMSYCVPNIHFNHLDFIIAVDIKKLLYEEVLKLIHKYTS